MFKILLFATIVVFVATLLLFLFFYLFAKTFNYLNDMVYPSKCEKPADNIDSIVPPSNLTSSTDFSESDAPFWLKDDNETDDDFNMESMNGYPGGYGDQQMFEDEEDFQDMDYGYIDKEEK
jgi:hypothetical protein